MLKTSLKWFLIIAGIAIVGFAVYGFALYLKSKDSYRISSDSMAPGLIKGDVIRVDPDAYRTKKPAQGEIVAFKSPDDPQQIMIFRVVATPGDRVIFPKGRLFVNEQPIQARPIAKDASREVFEETMGSRAFQVVYLANSPGIFESAALMGESDYFVAGDNRDAAKDSRYFGPIRPEHILGRVTKIEDSLDKAKIGREL